jgi:hypothetical protein
MRVCTPTPQHSLDEIVPDVLDAEVSMTSRLAQHISRIAPPSLSNHNTSSPSPDVNLVLSNGITENILSSISILSSIHEVGEAEDSSYDEEYLSDDEPLVQGFIGIRIVPEGSSFPEQLAVAQGVFLERASYSDESRLPKGSSSTKKGTLCGPGCRQTENPRTRRSRPCSPDGSRDSSQRLTSR